MLEYSFVSYFTTRRRINCAHRRAQQLCEKLATNCLFQNCKKIPLRDFTSRSRQNNEILIRQNTKFRRKFIHKAAPFLLFERKKETSNKVII